MPFDFKNIDITSSWAWITDILSLLLVVTFLTGNGDLLDLFFTVFVIFPRLRKINDINNGLIGYLRESLRDITPPPGDAPKE
jgi:hypothetical protein